MIHHNICRHFICKIFVSSDRICFALNNPPSLIHYLINEKYCYPPQYLFRQWLCQRSIYIVYLWYLLQGYQTYINCRHPFHDPPPQQESESSYILPIIHSIASRISSPVVSTTSYSGISASSVSVISGVGFIKTTTILWSEAKKNKQSPEKNFCGKKKCLYYPTADIPQPTLVKYISWESDCDFFSPFLYQKFSDPDSLMGSTEYSKIPQINASKVPKLLVKVNSKPKPDMISCTWVRRIQVICVLRILIPTKGAMFLLMHILVLYLYLIVQVVL